MYEGGEACENRDTYGFAIIGYETVSQHWLFVELSVLYLKSFYFHAFSVSNFEVRKLILGSIELGPNLAHELPLFITSDCNANLQLSDKNYQFVISYSLIGENC